LVQGFLSCAGVLVDGRVAGLPETVEEVLDFGRGDAAVPEAVEDRDQILSGNVQHARVSSGLLGEQFGKLPKADEGEIRVFKDEPLGLGTVADQERIVAGEKGEVWRPVDGGVRVGSRWSWA
jgi:hypothetical protein